MSVETYIIAAYALVPVIVVCGYVPQIVCLLKTEYVSGSFAFSTWILWLASSSITLAYTAVYIQDALLSITALLNVAPISAIIAIASWKHLRRPRFKVDARIDHHINDIAHQMHHQRDEREYIQSPQNDGIIAIDHALIPEQPETVQ